MKVINAVIVIHKNYYKNFKSLKKNPFDIAQHTLVAYIPEKVPLLLS